MILLASVEIRHNESNCTNQNPIKNKCKSKLTIGKKKPKDLYPILVISSNYDKIGKNYQVSKFDKLYFEFFFHKSTSF